MTKGYVKAVINKYDIERLKESVKVGDRLIYRTIFRDIHTCSGTGNSSQEV